jgi:hypothetical protein
MSVVAILMLGGVAVYFRMNRGFALQAATSAIESSLRSARAFAVHERSPAIVVAEPRADAANLVGIVYALGRQTVSNWHFEKEQFAGGKVLGALGQEATATGATPTAGRIGTALLLDGATTSLQVSSPYLDGLREGVFIEADVWPDATGLAPLAVLPIVHKDVSPSPIYELELCYQGNGIFSVQAGIKVEQGATAQVISIGTGTIPVPAAEWSHVAMAYTRDGKDATGNDKGVFVVSVNGQVVHGPDQPFAEPSMLLVPNTQPLNIGTDGTNFFQGRIDELKIAGLVAGETFEMPKNTEVTLDAGGSRDGRMHFDSEGRLDAAQHARPVIFRIISAEDRLLRSVRVTWLGAVEVFDGEPPD